MSLVNKIDNVALRRINIGRWGTPAAKRYGIKSIPQFWLVSPRGTVNKDKKSVLNTLAQAKGGRLK